VAHPCGFGSCKGGSFFFVFRIFSYLTSTLSLCAAPSPLSHVLSSGKPEAQKTRRRGFGRAARRVVVFRGISNQRSFRDRLRPPPSSVPASNLALLFVQELLKPCAHFVLFLHFAALNLGQAFLHFAHKPLVVNYKLRIVALRGLPLEKLGLLFSALFGVSAFRSVSLCASQRPLRLCVIFLPSFRFFAGISPLCTKHLS
jgi:hypothetical protein